MVRLRSIALRTRFCSSRTSTSSAGTPKSPSTCVNRRCGDCHAGSARDAGGGMSLRRCKVGSGPGTGASAASASAGGGEVASMAETLRVLHVPACTWLDAVTTRRLSMQTSVSRRLTGSTSTLEAHPLRSVPLRHVESRRQRGRKYSSTIGIQTKYGGMNHVARSQRMPVSRIGSYR